MNFSPKLRTGLALAWTFVIFLGITLPGPDVPPIATLYDKAFHVVIFAGFAGLWVWAGKRVGWVLLAGLGYAVFTEVYQQLMPIKRAGDVEDVVADSVGVFLGVALGWAWLRYVEKRLVG